MKSFPKMYTYLPAFESSYQSSHMQKLGSWKAFTLDHIQTLWLIIQKTKEYNQPLCLALVDYKKAFQFSRDLGSVYNAVRSTTAVLKF